MATQAPPQAGKVRLGTNLQVAYFDQLRQTLDDEATIRANVGDGGGECAGQQEGQVADAGHQPIMARWL